MSLNFAKIMQLDIKIAKNGKNVQENDEEPVNFSGEFSTKWGKASRYKLKITVTNAKNGPKSLKVPEK